MNKYPGDGPDAWDFQHDETGRMTILENDGVNNPENFVKNNPRFRLVGELYRHKQATPPTGLSAEEVEALDGLGEDVLVYGIAGVIAGRIRTICAALRRRTAQPDAPKPEVDDAMVERGLAAKIPEHVRAAYGYKSGYTVGRFLTGLTDEENRDVMRAALNAALGSKE